MSVFVYKITNNVNGKFYIGVHEGEVDDDYMGSGKAIKAAIKKYGLDNFTKEVVQICESKEAAYQLEKEIVTPELIESRQSYNLNTGGKGGWYHVDLSGDKNPMKRPEVAAKVSESIKKSITEEERKARSERMKKMRADGTVTKPKGWTHSEESKQKMSASRTGQEPWNKGVTGYSETALSKANKSDAAKKRIANGFDMGALGRGKKYNMTEKVCPHCGIIGKGGNMTRFHFDNCKNKEQNGHTTN